jgi:hypothetical protein
VGVVALPVAVLLTCALTATAASAPIAPASPANTPKWWVHLVGVSIIARKQMTVTPTMRRLVDEKCV